MDKLLPSTSASSWMQINRSPESTTARSSAVMQQRYVTWSEASDRGGLPVQEPAWAKIDCFNRQEAAAHTCILSYIYTHAYTFIHINLGDR